MFLSAFERLVAVRYLRARRQEGFISVIAGFSFVGILLGVGVLIVTMAVMNGFRADLLGNILGVTGHLTVTGSREAITDYDAMAAKIAEVENVVAVTPLIDGQVMVTANNRAMGALVRGLTAEAFAARPLLNDSLVAGSLKQFKGSDGVIVGSRLARSLGLVIGDDITLLSPRGEVTAFGTMPRMKAYPVAAIFEIGMYQYDSGYIYMPLDAAQLFFRDGKTVQKIEVMTIDADLARELQPEIEKRVGRGVFVETWQGVNSGFVSALIVERNVMFLILTLIILIASFNIISSQIMLVQDKGKGIAILRTMGATQGMIVRIFFATGASVGVLGTGVGAILGISFAANIDTIRIWLEEIFNITLWPAEVRFLAHMPSKIESGETIWIIVMALVLTFLASIYPAWRAGRLDPVEVLRYE